VPRLISPLDETSPCRLSRSIANGAVDAEGSDSTEDAWRVEAAASGTCTGGAAVGVAVAAAVAADPAAAAVDGRQIDDPPDDELKGAEKGVEEEGVGGNGTGNCTAASGTWVPASRTLDCTGPREGLLPAGTEGAK
jgi:hypothetical protein